MIKMHQLNQSDKFVNVSVWNGITQQWRIQDFPEGGREPSRGGMNTPNFPENCMKSKEFGRPGGACVPHAPPRSANAQVHTHNYFKPDDTNQWTPTKKALL